MSIKTIYRRLYSSIIGILVVLFQHSSDDEMHRCTGANLFFFFFSYYTRFNIAQKEEGVGLTKLRKKLLYYFVVKNIYTQQYGRKATSSSS